MGKPTRYVNTERRFGTADALRHPQSSFKEARILDMYRIGLHIRGGMLQV